MAIPAPAAEFAANGGPRPTTETAGTTAAPDWCGYAFRWHVRRSEAAIAEGATLVRIGTALFGSRPERRLCSIAGGYDFETLEQRSR